MTERFYERSPGKVRLGDITISASRFPWQAGYSWHGMTHSTAPLNQPLPGDKAAPRFGGGWKYKLGFAFSGRTLMVDLLFGIVTIRRETSAERERDRQWREERGRLRETRERNEANRRAALAAGGRAAVNSRDASGDDIPF